MKLEKLKNKIMGMVALAIVLGLAAGSLSACSNTAQGLGRDMQNTGRAIEDTF